MQASIALDADVHQQYLLRIADTCLILAQRTSEWCGHGPVLEEDIALANMALDLLGQARALLAHAGTLGGTRYDEDQLAFLRDERDYRNITLVELPRGDFAVTVLRNLLVAGFLKALWTRLAEASSDAELSAIAAKALKEARYHQQHAADWLLRLADGTAESRRRVESALALLWPYTAELFEADAVDEAARANGLGPAWAELREPWLAELAPLFDAAQLAMPAPTAFRSTGKQGRHSEHMGFLLAEMQHLQRAYPGGAW
jgi:ring-1,2-phenylacetyl-CoA epoxidase subunit PaaC